MRKRHIVFVLPGIGRLAYHFSTFRELVGAGHDVTFVSCRQRPSQLSRENAEFFDIIDEFEISNPNFRTIFESKYGIHIRTLAPRGSAKAKQKKFAADLYLLRCYARYLQRLPRDNFYVRRWKSYFTGPKLQTLAGNALFCALLRLPPVYWFLTFAERATKPDPQVTAWLTKVGADAVVASPCNTRNSVEADFLQAARKLGIPTAVPVLSWDNLTTKGLIPFNPDAVLVWNEHHAKEATDIHDIAAKRVIVTGSPFFDKWFDRLDLLQERGTFLRSLGLDPDKPVLLYLGSSKNIARNESWLVKDLLQAMQADEALASVQLLVRPHPANAAMVENLQGLDQVTVLGSDVPFTDRSIQHLLNALSHAFAVVGLNTSGLVDAVALDRPCFSVKTDRYVDTHLEAVHFLHMIEADAIGLGENVADLTAQLRAVLDGRDDRVKQRRHFVESLLRPRGLEMSAGRAAAQAIAMLAAGKPAAEVNRALDAADAPLPAAARPSLLEETAASR